MSFNSREYEWADITVIAGGVDLTKIRAIEYKEKIDREAVYAKGRNPHSIQSGNASYEGKITLLQSQYEALVDAGNGSVLSLSVDVETSYGTPPDTVSTDRAVGIRFTEAGKAAKQGDKFLEIELPFICLNILNHV